MEKKRVLLLEFCQETDTFNPIHMGLEDFRRRYYAEGEEAYHNMKRVPGSAGGIIDAIEEAGGEVIPTIFLSCTSGGRVEDSVFQLLTERLWEYIAAAGRIDAVCAALHGATCTESHDDACGVLLEYLRSLVGNIPITASFDLHANITERILRNTDIVCGFQTYPHNDIYETGYRAGRFCMKLLRGEPVRMAALRIPMLVPPAGYATSEEPFQSVMDSGHAMVQSGKLLDFTVFNVQPWLDIPDIASTVVTVAEDAETACANADALAAAFFANRDGYWPDLISIDEVIDRALANTTGKPVILADSADSTNGGAVGDSVAVAMRLLERGCTLRAATIVKDPAAVRQAFAVGVGNRAEFSVGAGYTPGMPGPLKAVGTVRSLHDGIYINEGPARRGVWQNLGLTAVISFGTVDVIVCHALAYSGDPQLFRHFGIEPLLYDLVAVKANTSFKLPYANIAGEICYADTPGAGSSNLKQFPWQKLPKGLYPFDLPEDYQLPSATVWTDVPRRS